MDGELHKGNNIKRTNYRRLQRFAGWVAGCSMPDKSSLPRSDIILTD